MRGGSKRVSGQAGGKLKQEIGRKPLGVLKNYIPSMCSVTVRSERGQGPSLITRAQGRIHLLGKPGLTVDSANLTHLFLL